MTTVYTQAPHGHILTRRGGRGRNRAGKGPAARAIPLQSPYTSDDADLELKSEDGVVFKIESYYLKAASGVFRGMLTSSAAALTPTAKKPKTTDDTEDASMDGTTKISPMLPSPPAVQPPIEIPAASLVVRLFVDLMHHAPLLVDTAESPSSPSSPGAPTSTHFTDLFRSANTPYRGRLNAIARLTSLLDLLDTFDCGVGMRERALAHFEPFFSVDPWAVFCLAGRYDDLTLAKKGIEKFGEIPRGRKIKVDPKHMGALEAEKIPLRWFMGYYRAFNDVERVGGDEILLDLDDRGKAFWAAVAAAFAPAVDASSQTTSPRVTSRGTTPDASLGLGLFD